MGNLYAESGLNPQNLQNTYEKKLGMTDASYTAAVDQGSYDNFVRDSAGYGLAQWTYWSRKQNLLNFAKERNASIGDLEMQLEFLWKELNGYKSVLNTLMSAKSVKEASDVVLTKYEKPKNQSEENKEPERGEQRTARQFRTEILRCLCCRAGSAAESRREWKFHVYQSGICGVLSCCVRREMGVLVRNLWV